jgi:TatA/E family protein of Tat protein translocase
VLSTIFSGWDDLIVILVALVVLFGGTQLPKLARNTGEALREFRKSHSEAESASAAVSAPAAPPATPAAPAALPSTAQVTGASQGATTPAPSDSVTLTRAELDAIVADRVAQSQAEGPKAGS